MSIYKCVNSFLSSKGKRFAYGHRIEQIEFNTLSNYEQRNFTKEAGYTPSYSSPSSNDSDSSINLGSMLDFGSSSFDSGSSSNDFGGFGGGDSGGAGAGGDW